MKKVKFDEKLERLVDEEGKKYEGRRFKTISAQSAFGHPTYLGAEHNAQFNLEPLAIEEGAEAYEVVSVQLHDSRQEYDPTPFTATATALLYQNR